MAERAGIGALAGCPFSGGGIRIPDIQAGNSETSALALIGLRADGRLSLQIKSYSGHLDTQRAGRGLLRRDSLLAKHLDFTAQVTA